MAEHIEKKYKQLFEIQLLHHYWLDEGAVVFDYLTTTLREKRVLSYDMRSFFTVAPTARTGTTLNGLGGVYKSTSLGCIVAAPDGAVIPDNATFEFVVTVRDAAVFNYTALTLRPQKIYEFYLTKDDKTYYYKYKEKVPVLSNLTGASRGIAPNKSLFLSKEIPAPAADDQVEALILSGQTLSQLTSDQPDPSTEPLYGSAAATDLPVFVHQGDVPVIVPPPDLAGVPTHGILLSSAIDGVPVSEVIPDDVFALIRLSAVRADDPSFSFIDNNGHAKSERPVFQVRFKNRSTIWEYPNRRTDSEDKPLPLTYFGKIDRKRKPAYGLVKVEYQQNSNTQISKLFSEIFA